MKRVYWPSYMKVVYYSHKHRYKLVVTCYDFAAVLEVSGNALHAELLRLATDTYQELWIKWQTREKVKQRMLS